MFEFEKYCWQGFVMFMGRDKTWTGSELGSLNKNSNSTIVYTLFCNTCYSYPVESKSAIQVDLVLVLSLPNV